MMYRLTIMTMVLLLFMLFTTVGMIFVGKSMFISREMAFVTNRDGNHQIYLMDTERYLRLNFTRSTGDDFDPAWSPDGRQMLFSSDRGGTRELYLVDSNGRNLRQLTSSSSDDSNRHAAWSKDDTILFTSLRNQEAGIYAINSAGNDLRFIADFNQISNFSDLRQAFRAPSPDGQWIARVLPFDNNNEIVILDADENNHHRITYHQENDSFPDWSPDASQVAFQSNRDGNLNIYMQNARCDTLPEGCAGTERRLTDHPASDYYPTWRP